MSTTLSMAAMVTKLQRKTGLGLAQADCVDFLNEAFRKINQSSKGGFIWQLKATTITVPNGAQVNIALPSDFDPGKTAVLRGNAPLGTATATIIPYFQVKDFVNQEHYQTGTVSQFSCWTFTPNFSAPTSYPFNMILGPKTAYPTATLQLPFYYHAVNYPVVAYGASNYFPSPDQFDSMIVDLAIAEVGDVYRMSDAVQKRQMAMQAINEIIDTYRSDRYDLSGLSDQAAQAQEKNFEKAK